MVAGRPAARRLYNASKGGVIMFTKSIALDLIRYNIRVNASAPAITATPLLETEILTSSTPTPPGPSSPRGRRSAALPIRSSRPAACCSWPATRARSPSAPRCSSTAAGHRCSPAWWPLTSRSPAAARPGWPRRAIVEVAGQLLAVEGGHRAIGAAAAQLLSTCWRRAGQRPGCSPSVPTSTVAAMLTGAPRPKAWCSCRRGPRCAPVAATCTSAACGCHGRR